jgi:alanine dehydrogenase
MDGFSPFSKQELQTQAERLEMRHGKKSLQIGIPKESSFEEKRVCLSPDSVHTLCNQGHQIIIETGAGLFSGFDDKSYSEAGATIAYDQNRVFSCQILLKVEPPTLEEIKLLKPNAVVFSALQIKTRTKSYFEALNKENYRNSL